MINYELSETVISLENGIYSTVYGINAEDERGNIHMSFSDISPNKDEVIKLCARCNEGCLSEIHFSEVVEDFMAELYQC